MGHSFLDPLDQSAIVVAPGIHVSSLAELLELHFAPASNREAENFLQVGVEQM